MEAEAPIEPKEVEEETVEVEAEAEEAAAEEVSVEEDTEEVSAEEAVEEVENRTRTLLVLIAFCPWLEYWRETLLQSLFPKTMPVRL